MGVWGVLATLGCAGGSAEAPDATSPEKVRVASDAKSVTVRGLTVTRPEGWEFVNADESLGENAELMLLGPIAGELRPSVVISRRPLRSSQKRVAPEAMLQVFAEANLQLFEGPQLQQEPVYLEIAGRPGAWVAFRGERISMTEDGAVIPVQGRVYGIVSDDDFWTLTGLVASGADLSELDSIVASLKL